MSEINLQEMDNAVNQARRIIDRPADRVYLGTCMVEQQNEQMTALYKELGVDR